MPIPKPQNDEKKNDYISRCMESLKDEDKPQDQKAAICYSQWDEKSESVFVADRKVSLSESQTIYPGDKIKVLESHHQNTPKTSSRTVGGGNTIITFNGSNLVTFNERTITLDTNGWWTKTTKRRMNQASDEHGLGYWVYQKKGQWYVDFQDRTIPFSGTTIILDR